jgi:hypothetical protein
MNIVMAGERPTGTAKMGTADYLREASTIVVLRNTLDDVFGDHRFFIRKSLSPCQIAQYVLHEIQQGERDISRLKTSIFERFDSGCPAKRFHDPKIVPDSSRDKQDMIMPTTLPSSYCTKIAVPPKATGRRRPVWFIVIWTLVVLLLGSVGNPDKETGPADPLQLLMVF